MISANSQQMIVKFIVSRAEKLKNFLGFARHTRLGVRLERFMLFSLMKTIGKVWPVTATAMLMCMTGQPIAHAATGALKIDQPPHLESFGVTIAGTIFSQWFTGRKVIAFKLCSLKNDTLDACVLTPLAAIMHEGRRA
jgi:hypothetical protein